MGARFRRSPLRARACGDNSQSVPLSALVLLIAPFEI